MTGDPDRHLKILREICLSEIRSDQPDLNLRQLAALLVVCLTDEPQTVRGLAKQLNISKPEITRALDRLEDLELLHQAIDGRDRRSVLVQRTAGGAAVVKRLGLAIISTAASPG